MVTVRGGSAFYTGDKWPEAYRHTFFLADAWFPSHSRWIQNVVVDADNQIIEIKEFVSPDSVEFPVDMTTDAQGYGLYIMRDYQDLYKQLTTPALGLSRTACGIGSPTLSIWCY